MASTQKPLLVFGTTPIYGHTMPLRAIAKNLIEQGYEVIFLTGSHFKKEIEAIGAQFVPFQGNADFSETTGWALVPPPPEILRGPQFLNFILRWFFAGPLVEHYNTLQSVLEEVEEREKGREVVVVFDQSWWGALPTRLGAPGLKPSGIVGIGIIPVGLSGKDVPPFGLSLKPDSSGQSTEKFAGLTKKVYGEDYATTQNEFIRNLKKIGVKHLREDAHIMDLEYTLPDKFLQMCVPSIEWPRVDLPKNFRFAGGLPKGHRDASPSLPEWWDDITHGKDKIVVVSQGTLLSLDFTQLIIPTLEGLKDLPGIIVVAALGRKGATLPEDYVVPSNARIGDFIPFDELFPLSDVFVTNGGYGGLNHALSHGLPMVFSGVQTDKPENAVRAEWAGVGVNLDVESPAPLAVREAVDKILGNSEYREKAKAIEREMDSYDPMGAIVQAIEEAAAEARLAKE
ncbi:UDP-Glycosyltransferase/glycogen phosphorylase [Mollisia scopiformis]|uniref:UDP-Glycosyltransferase/glycogen phosphorylase n=1 Tax=Mollisia scopiformis TaxID=149040 RepID=A0A132B544_MOLSC|nr:UDP-Glycosyltransferase/glycogen phosphorylase [Mollisia scopiformis]KUJ07109.1 UDP-Glycosyltransferase/glycogen phosphorylase [Mollisia scopiformis]